MNRKQLENILDGDSYARRTFCGVFPRDALAFINVDTSKPSIYIINTDPSYRRGEHWVAIYFNGFGKGEYFDSFGLPPRHGDIERFLYHHVLSYTYNRRVLQNVLSVTCGLYCVYYVMRKSRGESMTKNCGHLSSTTTENE